MESILRSSVPWVRAEFDVPTLPVVVATVGFGGQNITGHRGLQLVVGILDEAADLPRRFPTSSANARSSGIAKVGAVELADTIVR